ncbi:Carboxypeptidase D [Armadillidium vulgare]|nr:Carboxypeptidase D [Armadillidium vulgare]
MDSKYPAHGEMKDGGKCQHFTDGITNGADWYNVYGGMQDWNYVEANCFEITLEVSCIKYPDVETLNGFWNKNKEPLLHCTTVTKEVTVPSGSAVTLNFELSPGVSRDVGHSEDESVETTTTTTTTAPIENDQQQFFLGQVVPKPGSETGSSAHSEGEADSQTPKLSQNPPESIAPQKDKDEKLENSKRDIVSSLETVQNPGNNLSPDIPLILPDIPLILPDESSSLDNKVKTQVIYTTEVSPEEETTVAETSKNILLETQEEKTVSILIPENILETIKQDDSRAIIFN